MDLVAKCLTSCTRNCCCCSFAQPCRLFVTPRTAARQAPCPLPISRGYSNSCPLRQWCHPTISSSVVPFSSRPQSFPTSGTFQMSQLFATGGQSIGALASVLPKNIQGGFPVGLTGLISLLSKGLSRVYSNTTVHKLLQHHSSSVLSFLYSPTLTSIHDYWKNHSLD